MTSPIADMIRVLRERLSAIEAERTHIIGLLATYGEDVGQVRTPGMPASYSPPVFPPVPESEKVRLIKDANGRTGITPVIVEVARRYPGLDITQLANRVYDHITGDVPASRDGMRNMIKYAVERGRLSKRGDRYYANDPEGTSAA